MRTLAIRISISAQPEDVFRVLTDYENYPAWNPRLSSPQAGAEPDQTLMTKSQWWSALFSEEYSVVRLGYDSIRLKQAEGRLPRFAHTEREGTIYPKMDGSTLYTSKLYIGGSLQTVVGALYGKKILRQMHQEAQALKRFCETHYPYTRPVASTGNRLTRTAPPDIDIANAVRVAGFRQETEFPADISPVTYH